MNFMIKRTKKRVAKDPEKKAKVLFVTTALEHRTFRKTVRSQVNLGVKVSYIGFTRNNYPPSEDGLKEIQLGELTHGNYVMRAIRMLLAVCSLRRAAVCNDVIYCFSLDTLVLMKIANFGLQKPVVFHVQDIRPVLIGNGAKANIARMIERGALRKIVLLVISSGAFYKNHFKTHYDFPESRVMVIENKLEYPPSRVCHVAPDSNAYRKEPVIRIGYFGMLRCARSWHILKNVASSARESIEISVWGKPVGLASFHSDIEMLPNASYGGAYRDPDDLPSLYGSVDLVWAAYPYGFRKIGNWQWARTVRFYEAGAFGIPVVVQEGTQDAEFLREHDIGLSLNLDDIEGAISEILSVSWSDIERWRLNIKNIEKSKFIHTNEYIELARALYKVRNISEFN